MSQPWDGMCSTQRLHELHAGALEKFGGAAGMRDPNCPEGTLGNAWSACQYSEIGESLPHLAFAAYGIYYFVRNHCFADGNKRAGWLVMSEALASMDLEVSATTDEAVEFVTRIAEGKLKVEDVLKWIEPRLVSIPRLPRA